MHIGKLGIEVHVRWDGVPSKRKVAKKAKSIVTRIIKEQIKRGTIEGWKIPAIKELRSSFMEEKDGQMFIQLGLREAKEAVEKVAFNKFGLS